MTSEENNYLHIVRQDCPLPPGTHVVIYCRDSGGEEQDRSVTQQIETAKEYCRHHNLIVDRVFVDEAKVSSNTDKRGSLQEMLHLVRGQFKTIHDRKKRAKSAEENPFGIIFWKSNRLGRDSIEATHIKTDLRLRGITLIDLVTSANTGNSAVDALIEAFQQWKDEQELDEISQNSRRGLAQLVSMRDDDPEFLRYNPGWKSTGAYLGLRPGALPKGFKAQEVQIGVYKRKKGRNVGEARIVQRMVPDPETWDRCRLAWEMRHNGSSHTEIHRATRLFKNVNGYDTFFSNPIYIGEFHFGGKVYENFVEPMISREWFEQEQREREERQKKQQGLKMMAALEPRRVGSDYLLSGLVYCGFVDGEEHPMHIESIPGKPGKRGTYTFFICATKKNSRNTACQAGRVSLKALDQSVTECLLSHILTVENLRPLARNIAESLQQRSDDAGTRIEAIEDKLAEVQKSLQNILDALENMGYAKHLQQRYDERKREEEELLTELHTLQALRVTPEIIQEISDHELAGWIEHMRAALEGEDRSAARRIIQQFVAKIVIKEGTGTIFYSFPFPERLYMSSVQHLDLRRFELLTSTVRL